MYFLSIILTASHILNLRTVYALFRWHEMEKLGCLGGTFPDRKFIYHACLLLLHWQDPLLIRSQTEHSNWICNCPLRDTARALLCSLIIIQSKLVVDKVIIMTIRCGSIPCTPQESHSVMLAARTGSQPHGVNRTRGGLRCLLAASTGWRCLYTERGTQGPRRQGR